PDLSGQRVLDIGAWDGYFSFEFERRGAQVLAIDTYAWDHGALDCFLFARQHFGSKVEYRRMDVHDLAPEAVGPFDLVFCAGVLYHMRNPLIGLERIRSVTAGRLILETHCLLPALHEWVPLITFFPGDEDATKFAWHHGGYPTRAWVVDALKAAGFARSEVIYAPSFRWGKKLVALATNTPQSGRQTRRKRAASSYTHLSTRVETTSPRLRRMDIARDQAAGRPAPDKASKGCARERKGAIPAGRWRRSDAGSPGAATAGMPRRR